MKKKENLIQFLLQQQNIYHNWGFVENDPIQVPHRFAKKQDIEIASLFATLFALGKRKIIIQKTNDLLQRMDDNPFDFVKNFSNRDLRKFENFVHRFFKYEDIVFLLSFLQQHYQKHLSLENAFTNGGKISSVYEALINFQINVFKTAHSKRSEKHISSPLTHSACKRLNLLLRWLVRKDEHQIDFGIWNFVEPKDLIIPLDVHVLGVCKKLKIVSARASASWQTALEITSFLKNIDYKDPIKFDFAFMGIGVNQVEKE